MQKAWKGTPGACVGAVMIHMLLCVAPLLVWQSFPPQACECSSAALLPFVNLLHILAPPLETVHRFPQQLSLKVEHAVGASSQIVTRLSNCLWKTQYTRHSPHFLYMYMKNKSEYSTAFLSFLIAAYLLKVV